MAAAKFHSVIPKLPATDLAATKSFYEKLNFRLIGEIYPDYLMMYRDDVEIHFFLFKELNVAENYGMCYLRVTDIETIYAACQKIAQDANCLGELEPRPWKQKEFSITDNNNNQLTFGEAM